MFFYQYTPDGFIAERLPRPRDRVGITVLKNPENRVFRVRGRIKLGQVNIPKKRC